MSKCRSCGGPIIWATIDSRSRHPNRGKRHPFNAEPDLKGKWELVERGRQDGPVARYVKGQDGLPGLFESERYTSHFATCPDADQWRKR
ncbi:MAG TPA: hypothetical protein VGK41_08270 [Solirubrobacterales bacterium]